MASLPKLPYGGPEWQETSEKKVQRILAEELKRRGWDAKELEGRRKGDGEKVRIAQRLRTETSKTLSWIARQLSMGTAGSLANRLRKEP